MLLVGLARRSIGFKEFGTALIRTAETTAMIFVILLGAEVFNAFLAFSQLPMEAAQAIVGLGLPPHAVLIMLLAFYILLGAVMDELAMILLTLPVFFPIITALDFGMAPDDVAVWFGILVLIVCGIGLTAPPIGLNVFVVNAIARDVPMFATYRAVAPFVAADVFRLALVVIFPSLALWLMWLLAD
jgi:TRAP-type C4-dicarboxylate transport system permease large subunit